MALGAQYKLLLSKLLGRSTCLADCDNTALASIRANRGSQLARLAALLITSGLVSNDRSVDAAR